MLNFFFRLCLNKLTSCQQFGIFQIHNVMKSLFGASVSFLIDHYMYCPIRYFVTMMQQTKYLHCAVFG